MDDRRIIQPFGAFDEFTVLVNCGAVEKSLNSVLYG